MYINKTQNYKHVKENLRPKKVYFKEEQKYTQGVQIWILIVAFLASIIPFVIGMYQQLVLGKPWGDQPMSDSNLIFTFLLIFILMGGLVVLFTQVKLQLTVDEQGIRYRFPFYVIREKVIPAEQIERYEIRTYRPLMEYGGWGYKVGIHRKLRRISKWGSAMTIKGKTGLQLYLKDGNKLLIGTQRAEALRRAMEKMMNKAKNND
jgi:membrane protein YdbS with pleckstrin-like domain